MRSGVPVVNPWGEWGAFILNAVCCGLPVRRCWLVLDTSHLAELGYRSVAGQKLSKRLGRFDLPAVIPIVTVQERIGGMLARINQMRQDGTGK